MRVIRWCDGSYLEDQDHWWLSGIHRDVELQSVPKKRVLDYFVRTTPKDASLNNWTLVCPPPFSFRLALLAFVLFDAAACTFPHDRIAFLLSNSPRCMHSLQSVACIYAYIILLSFVSAGG